jgi:hypothetical protein
MFLYNLFSLNQEFAGRFPLVPAVSCALMIIALAFLALCLQVPLDSPDQTVSIAAGVGDLPMIEELSSSHVEVGIEPLLLSRIVNHKITGIGGHLPCCHAACAT